MKKVLLSMTFVAATALVACGPSAEDKAKQEALAKEKMDSLFNAAGESMAADSADADTSAH